MNTATKDRGKALRLFTGGLPFTAVLTAILYLQGRAYYAGFLQYFHIDNTQMSITTADAMWYAYYAWGNGAASVLFKAGSIFFDLIYHFAPP